ncbi:MAG: MG2 domain-containing protein [Polyangiaceae bacterium]
MIRNILNKLCPLAAATSILGAALPTIAEDAETKARLDSLGKRVESQLAATPGKTIYLMTDKPLYHPGEAIWFRAWEVAVKSLEGTAGEHGVTFQLLDARGSKVMEKRVLSRSGMATNDFQLPAGIAGGGFTLRAISDSGGQQDRLITVAAYEAPRIKKTLDFLKTSYGPGDEVTAKVTIEAPTGGPLLGAKATAIVTVDGVEVTRSNVFPDEKGRAWVRFLLPSKIAKGDGLLTIQVDGGGFVEAIQRRIPIALEDVTVSLFPEGGDLVDGLPSRVYLSARDPQNEPVEVEGQVFDDRGAMIGDFKSLYNGMARFSITPAKGRAYNVKITKPKGAAGKTFALPTAKADGCTIRTLDDFTSVEGEIKVRAQCSAKQDVLATAVLREKLIAKVAAPTIPGNAAVIALPIPKGSTGAVRVTLFDTEGRPLAERLVYRGLGQEMSVKVTADRKTYSPREKVTLTVETKDAGGKPVSADVALAVVDDTVLKYADDKEGHILSQVYLLPEMPGQTVREPNFYFSKDRRAPEAMDLLLGTQGYRRFAWKWVQ